MQPGEMNIDPIESEFFSTEAIGSLADALVRESIQNSLDARRAGVRVRVRIALSRPADALTAQRASAYLEGLAAHVAAGKTGGPARGAPLDFVVVEDFGTRGLQGDPRQIEDEQLDSAAARNDFYYFWRNVGRSRKGASDLGRWGLGKTVFAAASRASAFFGLTVRADPGVALLMGQSVLRIHKIGDARYYPYGYYGRFDGDFALPVDDASVTGAFRRDFGLVRDGEPGLSVVIPYPDPELTPEAILSSVVHHYFVPILAGDLVVEIEHDGRRERLDASSLGRIVDRMALGVRDGLARVVDLARWGLALAPGEAVELPLPSVAAAPRWAGEASVESAVDPLRDPFNRGGRIALRVPMWVKPAAGEPLRASFDIWLERDDDMAAADERFVRDGITVAGVRGGVQAGVRAIVFVSDRTLSTLLGDSENPAHTEWQERSPRFRDRYRHGASTLRYVKGAPREVVRVLTRPAQGRDFALLRHVFSLEVPTEEAARFPVRGQRAGAEDAGVAPGIPGTRSAASFELQRLHDGFCVAGTGAGGMPQRYLALRAAYEVRRGNPFALYQPFDFEMDREPIVAMAEGATFVRRAGNEAIVRIDDPGFRITIRGFDPRRDVRVKAIALDEEPAA